MKGFTATAFLVIAVVWAEPPLSKSYLPPSPNRNPGGFNANLPEVVAARSGPGFGQGFGAQGLGGHGSRAGGRGNFGHHGQAGSGLGRTAGQGYPDARFGGQSARGYGPNAGAFGRNGIDESGEPANYNFGYMVNDDEEGTDFGHHEARQDAAAHGEYHVVLPDGRKQTVSYEADERGFKPRVSYQDSDLGRVGGYDANANNVGGFGNNGYGNNGYGNNGYGGGNNGAKFGGSKGGY